MEVIWPDGTAESWDQFPPALTPGCEVEIDLASGAKRKGKVKIRLQEWIVLEGDANPIAGEDARIVRQNVT